MKTALLASVIALPLGTASFLSSDTGPLSLAASVLLIAVSVAATRHKTAVEKTMFGFETGRAPAGEHALPASDGECFFYRVDLRTRAFTRVPTAFRDIWGSGYAELFAPGGYDLFEARMHPIDRVASRCRFAPSDAQPPGCVDVRIEDDSGRYRWWRDQANLAADRYGRPRYLNGSLTEVTDLKEATPIEIARAKASEAVLRGMNEALELQLAERDAQLSAALKELEALSHAVSHDLRTPLRAIDGYSSALMTDHGERLDGEAWTLLQRLRSGVHHMSDLIDHVQELAQVTCEPLDYDEVDLSALAAEVADSIRQGHPLRQVQVEIVPGMITRGDAKLLRVALEKLLGNAWKFTATTPHARVRVGCCSDDAGVVWYFVEDNGVGFDLRQAHKLFAPFRRLHDGRDAGAGGGIGLALVARIVHRHGGRVCAERGDDGGARFAFRLEPSRISEEI